MGVLPLAYEPGTTRQIARPDGARDLRHQRDRDGPAPRWARHSHRDRRRTGKVTTFQAVVRLNSPVELDYYRHGGILQRVLRMF